MDRIGIYTGVLGFGGIESAVISQLEKIDHSSLSYDVIIDDTITNSKNEERVLALGDRIISLHIKSGGRFYKLRKYIALYRLVKKNHYRCVHFHFSFPSSLLYGLVARMAGTKGLVTSHACGPAKLATSNRFVQSISRFLYPGLFTSRIAVSSKAGRWMYGKYTFDVLPNAIDIDKYKFNKEKRKEVRKELGIQPDSFVLGHVGRFVSEKNHSFILCVFQCLVEEKPDSHLILVGDGKGRNEIVEKAHSMGLASRVHIIEKTEFVENYLSSMDCFIFPSFREGFGLVAIEAQANNLPVVASDTIPEETRATNLIKYLSLNDNVSDWCDSILKCIVTDAERRNPVSPSLREFYSIANLTNKLIRYYDK